MNFSHKDVPAWLKLTFSRHKVSGYLGSERTSDAPRHFMI